VEELVSVSATTSVSIVLNAGGSPIATKTMLVISTFTPSYVTPSVISLTDERGVVTATSTITPRPIMIPTVTTLTGPDGVETATVVTNVLATPRVVTYTDARGAPTTVTEYPTFPTGTAGPGRPAKVYQVSHGAYFVGLFLPTIITSLLTIPIRMIDMGAKQLQPWHELTRPNGATAAESLCLRTGGLFGIRSSIRAVMRGQGLIFLTTLLILCSVALVPLSAEAVALKVHGNCTETDFRGCAMSLGVFLGPAKALIGLLVFMAVLVVAILVILSKWRSGVAANPWTIAGVSSLSMNEDFRALFASLPRGITGGIDRKRLLEAFEGKAFRLDYFTGENGTPEYGIVVQREVDGTGPRKPGIKESIYARMSRWETHRPRDGIESVRREHHLPFLMLSYRWRLVFLAFVTFLLVVVIYYARTNLDTPFERFMDAQDFGVTALFALVGITITFYWSAFFNSKSFARSGREGDKGLTISRPDHLESLPCPSTGPAICREIAAAGVATARCRGHGHLERHPAPTVLSRRRRPHVYCVRVYDDSAQQRAVPDHADIRGARGLHVADGGIAASDVGGGCLELLRDVAAYARRPEHHCRSRVLRARLQDAGGVRGVERAAQGGEGWQGVRDGGQVPVWDHCGRVAREKSGRGLG